jgi:hypothetical protein
MKSFVPLMYEAHTLAVYVRAVSCSSDVDAESLLAFYRIFGKNYIGIGNREYNNNTQSFLVFDFPDTKTALTIYHCPVHQSLYKFHRNMHCAASTDKSTGPLVTRLTYVNHFSHLMHNAIKLNVNLTS